MILLYFLSVGDLWLLPLFPSILSLPAPFGNREEAKWQVATVGPALTDLPPIIGSSIWNIVFLSSNWHGFASLIIFFKFIIIIFFFYFTILYWFCHTSTCICHGCTHGPYPDKFLRYQVKNLFNILRHSNSNTTKWKSDWFI